MKNRLLRMMVVLAAVAFANQSAFAGDGQAQLGQDPRLPANGQTISDNFGFAFMQNVQKGSPQTDTCATVDKQGNHTLTAIDGVASPENPEPILCTLNGDTATFSGRTGDGYYMVTGAYGGGGGGGGAGGGIAPTWQSDFDTNPDEIYTPHFVVYINERYRSDDDEFTMNDSSRVTVELHNAVSVMGSVHFKLSQIPLEGEGAVTFVDASDTPIDPDQVHVVFRGEPFVIYAKGLHVGVVSIIAHQTDFNGNPPPVSGVPDVKTGTASGPVVDTVWLVTHNPKWEKFAQAHPYCKQAELMSNKLYLTCDGGADKAGLYQKGLFGDTYICDGQKEQVEGGVRFVFDPSSGSSAGHKTDADGSIYIEGVKLNEPNANSPSPKDFVIKVIDGSGNLLRKQDVKIAPAIELLEFNKTKLLDLQALDPSTDKHAYQMGGGGYGLQIDYNYYTWWKFLPDCGDGIVQVENATQDEVTSIDGSRPGTMATDGKAYLIPSASELLEYNCWSHAIKWEGFDDTFHAAAPTGFGQNEEAQKTFMEGDPLPSPATPDNLVGEGCYKLTFGVKLKSDSTQKQRFSVVFSVQYKKDSGPDARSF